jgi:hypothetical protein
MIAAIIRNAVALAAAKVRSENSRGGSIGPGVRSSQTMNAQSSTMPALALARTSTLL